MTMMTICLMTGMEMMTTNMMMMVLSKIGKDYEDQDDSDQDDNLCDVVQLTK